MKTIFKKAARLTILFLLLLVALVGGFAMMAPRRPEQDYDNEVKTELVEAKESTITEEKK